MQYKLTDLFKEIDYLKQSNIAYRCKMNSGRFRQYTSGSRPVSDQRLKQIQDAIHEVGRELLEIKLIS